VFSKTLALTRKAFQRIAASRPRRHLKLSGGPTGQEVYHAPALLQRLQWCCKSDQGQSAGRPLPDPDEQTVRNLRGHQYADVVVLVHLGDLVLEQAGSFGSNDWISEAMKLGHEAPALVVQISIRDRHV
jgi:hypothetical protein